MRISIATICLLALPALGHAHGINGHVIVTDGALEYMQTEELRELLSEPEVREAFQIGASFPDSGYAPTVQRYGEAPHWEPFVEAQLDYMQEHFQPPYDELETKRIIAFNLGSISHGMEDEIFDTLFDLVVLEHGESDLDTALDVFLVIDGHERIIPPLWFPAETMFDIYNNYYGDEVPQNEMERGMQTVYSAVLEFFDTFAPAFEAENHYTEKLPWARENFMDPQTPSSFPHEMTIMGPYLDAVWKRLHGEFTDDDLIVGSVPVEGEWLLSNDHESADSWVSIYFGMAVWEPDLNAESVRLYDADGVQLPATIDHTRWSSGTGWTRVLRVIAEQPYAPDADYEVVIDPGVGLIDGTATGREYRLAFRSYCSEKNAEDCVYEEPPVGDDDDGVTTDDDDVVANDDDDDDALPSGDDDDDDDDGGGSSGGCMSAAPSSGVALLLLFPWVAIRRRRG